MKSSIKTLVGIVVASMALSACGKKGGGSSNAGTPGAGAVGVCQLNAQGMCVGGTAQSGVVPANTWEGRPVVTNQQKYAQFLADNGLCYGPQCGYASGFFTMKIRTVEDQSFSGAGVASLPSAVNFAIVPRFGGYPSQRALNTQGDGYATASGPNTNGFQIVYNRFNGLGYGMNNMYGNNFYRPGIAPYGQPVQTVPTAQNSTLQIGVVFADATQTIVNVSIVYQGVQIANGQLRANYPNAMGINGINGINGMRIDPRGAPQVLPPQNNGIQNW